jgi:hypothetical protein
MLDFIFNFATSILHVNLRDPHDIPFALPLVFCAILGFVSSFIILKFVGNEKKQDSEQQD